MNKIYKVIWSHVKQCYVVTSELAKAHGRTSIGGGTSRLAVAALTAFILTAGVTGVGLANTVTDNNGNTITNTDTKITDINANVTGKDNKVTDSSNAEIVGDKNTVTNEVKDEKGNVVAKVRSNDARIVGSNNTISGSRNQQVIGDHNTIIGRDKGTVTDYGHPEGRDLSVADITIGRENTIHSGDTYRNEWDSLTIIGNHNIADSKLVDSAGGPASGIVVGSNQNIDGIEESIVIGSLSPAEQNEKTDNPNHHDKYTVGRNSIILGNHASNTMGESIVVGNRSQGNGEYQTIMGHRSIIQGYADQSEANHVAENYGALSSIYGAFNTIESARPVFEDSSNYDPYFKSVDGFGNSINGTLNKTSSARGTMIMGAANTVTHSQPDIIKANVFGTDDSMDDVWLQDVTSAVQYYNLGDDNNLLNLSYDDAIAAMKAYATNASGAVSVLGNGNVADYAIRSQILGTANTLTGNENKISANNTINGYGNTGTNITHSAVVGSNNTLSNGEDNVVIGDYHNIDGGKHNVVLGSMKSKEQTSQKEYKSPVWQDVKYNVTEQVPVKDHTKDIENAVMVGYNTDVTQTGGVALGSDSIASTEAGKTGYDAKGKTHAKSDKDYAAWVSTDAAVSVGGADREITYDVLDKDGKPVIDKATGKTKQETQIVKSTRQITNLAAGTEDTDAVNVAQMKVTATAAADAVKTHFYSVNSQDTKAGNYNNDGAKGKSAINAIAAGVGASSDGDSSIAVGTNSRVASNGYSLTSIAIGKNAYVLNGTGQQEFQLSFDKGNWNQIFGYSTGPKDISRIPGGIAIGTNSYARTGSVQIGAHTYTGKMGNMDVTDKTNSEANIVDMTTIGSNTYNRGALATMVGAYSIITGDFDGSGSNSYSTGTQNFGANVIGSLNSIRTKGYSGTSGVANSIVGIANIAENANGALIYGAGNQISNSIRPITSIDVTKGSSTVDGMVDSLRNAVQKQEGGATLAIGGGNTANWTQASQLMGVDNTLTGTETSVSEYNLIDGYKNTATHVKHATVIGSGNTVSGEEKDNVEGLILLGDNRNVWKQADHSVVIGSSDDTGHSYVTRPDTVIIGHNAYIEDHGGNTSGGGDIAIGHNSFVENYVNQSGSIAFGENTHVRNSVGSTENAFVLGQYEMTQDPAGTPIPTDVAKMNASIAIGENTFARTGSLMIGTHKYTGEIGDTTVDTSDATSMAQANQQINETVLGTNSFSLGAFSTVTGAYSIISGDYDKGKWRNFGSSITGSLNSIESKTATTADAGNASHIIGTANRMQNANGAVVIGSGNEITDSYAAMSMPTSNNTSAKDLSEKIRESIKANGGGAAAIVGNGNEVKKSTNVAVMGSKNSVTSTTNSQIFGDNRVVTGADGAPIEGAVIIGSATAESSLTTDKKNVTILGHNANATVEGGVALGADSVASVDKGAVGYDLANGDHSGDTTGVWKSKAAAVSVGDASKKITRQITNVAAGKEDTDAVNVAQLKAVSSAINTDITASKTHFYSVNSTDEKAKNYDNKGATGANALAAGVGAQALKDSTVAIGDAAHAESSNSVVIGTGAWTRSSNGDKPTANGGDVAIGQKAYIDSYVNQGGSIALGQNARVENTNGSTERKYAFGQTEFEGDNIPLNPGNEAGGVAIGRNSFARTGSLMVGTHMYKGAIADMDEVDGTDSQKLREDFNNINMTTLGTNSFNNGTFATVTGSYSATTAKKKIQNFAATVDGSLNSIESYKDAADNSGVASSIVGTANRIANSNNTTILGAGNEVTNSLTDITAPTEGGDSAKALQDTLKGKLQQDAKGAVVVSGIGNKVDSSHGVSVLGSRNVVNTTDNIQLLGDNREVTGATGSVIIGSADSKTTTSVTDATILGHNANVEKEGGVALGAGSVASREAGVAGYDPATKADSTDSSATWKATDAAVSVGKEDGSMTRQITGVAAGSKATDAVNVAQLQKALAGAKDGNDTLKSGTDALKLDGNKLSMNIQDTAGNTVSGSVDLSKFAQAVDTNTTYTLTGQENKDNTTTITFEDNSGNKNSVTVATKDTRNTVKAGENVTLDTKDNADGSHEYTVNVKADGKVEAGSTKIVSGGTVYNETRVAKDGTFVKQSNTAGENLTALDNQVTSNTESIYHMNNRVSNLDNRINKVGAGAAALAALHPLDFNPDDKWDFAVGYGNYRNANSVALGAFYRPNEDTMFSLGTNFGNGENMFNAGVSFKIGKGNSYAGVSKAQLVAENQQLKANDALQDQKIQKQDQEIQELKKALEELKSRIK